MREKYFKDLGFVKNTCKKCGSVFFSKRKEEFCQDCREYEFLERDLPIKRYKKSEEVREDFMRYWENLEIPHKRVKPYPVVARWRDDVYLTGASIYDFQPTGGFKSSSQLSVPANPLVISQPCIRETDLVSVGITGRHLSSFEMMAHHAFNTREEHYYWEKELIEFSYRYFVDVLGLDESEIHYLCSEWAGGGNKGFCYEVFYGGIEIATLVLMDKTYNEKTKEYEDMDLKVIDTGYGLERILWIGSKKPSCFLSLYEKLIKKYIDVDEDFIKTMHICSSVTKFSENYDYGKLVKEISLKEKIEKEVAFEKVIKYKSIFSLADFSRAVMLLLGDLTVPSNKEEGYTVRTLIRKCLSSLFILNLNFNEMFEVIRWQISRWKDSWESVWENKDYIMKILEREVSKFVDTLKKGKKQIEKWKNKKITCNELVFFYDSFGIPIEISCKELGIKLEDYISCERYIFDRGERSSLKKPEELEIEVYGETRKLYEENPYLREMFIDKKDLKIFEKKYIILKESIFYPTKGGQECDHGVIGKYYIESVYEKDGCIIHKISKEYEKEFVLATYFKDSELVKRNVDFSFKNLKELLENAKKFREKSPTIVVLFTEANKSLEIFLEKLLRKYFKFVKVIRKNNIELLEKFLDESKEYVCIDWERRYYLMRMHTATHILLRCCKEVLGKHVWQAGAEKRVFLGRLDIRHFDKIGENELKEIEELANLVVKKDLKVSEEVIEKSKAIEKYGFEIFQGGAPPLKKVRLIKIEGFDVQACGGTHVKSTREIGVIKIIKRESISDGVERIYFAIDEGILEEYRKVCEILEETRKVTRGSVEDIPKTVYRFFNEMKKLESENKELKEKLLEILLRDKKEIDVFFDDVGIFVKVLSKIKDRDYSIVRGKKICVIYFHRDFPEKEKTRENFRKKFKKVINREKYMVGFKE